MPREINPIDVELRCRDGVRLRGHWWPSQVTAQATVVINSATGVAARYYNYYARFLTENGFNALTYDYRGIGLSRPTDLKGITYTWREWGEQDFDAALDHALKADGTGRVLVVGHSIGGFLPGYAGSVDRLDGLLSVGGQYGYWGDYMRRYRPSLFVKWHLAMPLVTQALGYFPGKRLGWLEDLPKHVALEWALQRGRVEQGLEPAASERLRENFRRMRAPVLSVTMSDDPIATPAAIRRATAYYSGATTTRILLSPEDLGHRKVGHFGLFHARHRTDFWEKSLEWLRHGENPWPERVY
ncbi:alpha/beta fold hydrolase [Peteryoungia desertarenae]|uniref:Alpha/beta fold hydrolase n=1 Tax=Peteryoungia desertarenae TaxID=1813451 RepID=A0ABX6QL74_9HYPH|nr:alpha/beta fold hydrolase [Peteryoungia desertarenae]QLF69007.1 alpha/beta fold hydrolase [Peteryoungia desertarenae]